MPRRKIRLKELREAAGLTQEQLSRKAKLPLRTVQRIETGEQGPRLTTAVKLARALAVPLDDLVRPPEEPAAV